MERKILDGEFTNSSRVNYLQSLKEFDKFAALKSLKTLDQITEEVIVDESKPWRKKAIIGSNNSGEKANGLSFDLTV